MAGDDDPRGARTRSEPDAPGSWHSDPFARHQSRWWDGNRWTERVRDETTVGIDPPGIDPAPHAPASDAPEPANPIGDARVPLRPPPASTQLARILGVITMVGLTVLIVVVAIAAL
ncbi:MAG: DUF2510 domain-containing protein [Acidimicrobiales bacterium]